MRSGFEHKQRLADAADEATGDERTEEDARRVGNEVACRIPTPDEHPEQDLR